MSRWIGTTAVRHASAAALALAIGVPLAVVPAAAGPRIPGTTCEAFPADSWWKADVSRLPVHARSAQWMARMSPSADLHPDFGPSFGAQSVPYGIPITIVGSTTPRVPVTFQYASESDRVRYPLGTFTKVEGGQYTSGDRHTITIDRDTCRLYETWATSRDANNRWRAGSGAIWSLISNRLRTDGWTSADAAGLPILPGLLRYDEVAARNVDHAIRFTTDVTSRAYLWPARHHAGSTDDLRYPPMGARFRMKASWQIPAGTRADTRAVLVAMKKYGLVLADNGSPWYFQGTADTRWPNAMLDQLKNVPASAFEAVDTSSLKISPDSMKVRAQR